MKLPSYLRQNKHNVYVFRRRVPRDLISFFDTNEIRKSLYETNKKIAVQKARNIALECDKLFSYLRNDFPMSNDLPKPLTKQLSELIKHKKELLAKDMRISEKEEKVWSLHRKILDERNAHSERLEREMSIVKSTSSSAIETAYKPKGKEVLLSKMIEHFFENNELKRRDESLATVRKDRDALRLFQQFVGDKLISDVNQSDAAEFAKNITTYKITRSKSRAALTANGYLNCVSKFSGWVTAFHSETHHTKLDFSRFKYKRKIKPSEARDAFTDAEVSIILNHSDFIKLKEEDPSVYWVIYIAAYSGARLEEIAQLDPINDIYQKNSILIFDINSSDDKSLKNHSSKRQIPIHSKLLEVGLIDYVEKLKKEKLKVLVLNERKRDGRIGKNTGKRISYLIQKKIGISNKSLHCFRHTLTTKLKRLGVDELIAAAITGHENGGITYKVYGKDFLPQQLKEAIEKVVF
jgi:integrase